MRIESDHPLHISAAPSRLSLINVNTPHLQQLHHENPEIDDGTEESNRFAESVEMKSHNPLDPRDVEAADRMTRASENIEGGESNSSLEETITWAKYPPVPPIRPPSPDLFTRSFDRCFHRPVPSFLSCIGPHFNWKGIRPVIRSAIALEAALILLLGDKSEALLGQTSFLILIVAVMSPASLPIASQIETAGLQIVLVSLSWAYGCLFLLLANQARTNFRFSSAAEFNTYASNLYTESSMSAAEIVLDIELSIYHGNYLEANSSVICAIFFGIGCGLLLWFRGFAGPGPFTFGCVFAIILIVIMSTFGALFPYAYYGLGNLFFLPFICQTAINLLVTFFVFPETLAHQFCDSINSTLVPLATIVALQTEMLATDPSSNDNWDEFNTMKGTLNLSMTRLAGLVKSESNLKREATYSKVSARDLSRILRHVKSLVGQTSAFLTFHQIVDYHFHKTRQTGGADLAAEDLILHINSTRPSSLATAPSRAGSVNGNSSPPRREPIDLTHLAPPSTSIPATTTHQNYDPSPLAHSIHVTAPTYSRTHPEPVVTFETPLGTQAPASGTTSPARSIAASIAGGEAADRTHRKSRSLFKGHHFHLSEALQNSLHTHREVKPVGLVESQRYMDLEDYLHNPRDEAHIQEIITLLSKASGELLSTLDRSLSHIMDTIHDVRVNHGDYQVKVEASDRMVETLEKSLKEYRDWKRLDVIKPFASIFDPTSNLSSLLSAPSHRGLFWAFSYQNALMTWSETLILLIKETTSIEKKRERPKMMFPLWRSFTWRRAATGYNEDLPEAIPGLNQGMFTSRRNPDHLAPITLLQEIGESIHSSTRWMTRSDILFGIKSAFLLPLVALPAFFPSSAFFFYTERGIWVVIMAALTSQQFVGDTAFGFVSRIYGTLAGAIVGLILWYGGSGTSSNPYGLAIICGAAFPFLLFHRIHYVPVVAAILTSLTAALVVGYSHVGAVRPALSSVGSGWPVAWRRMLCVTIGVTAAFIFAYIPPTITQKETVRRTYAKVIGEMGGVMCQIFSYANLRSDLPEGEENFSSPPLLLVQNIAALRDKVLKTTAVRLFISYELSLQGPWPAQEYNTLQAVQLELLDLIGQFLGIVSSLDGKWNRALMSRSQFNNPRFLGELLSSFQLIAQSLQNKSPLPQIYNPLLERFLKPTAVLQAGHSYGFDAILGEDDDIPGIPLHVDLATICSLEYLKFSCGISAAYAIVNRVDRLMLIAKTLVGESYLIYGLKDEQHHTVLPEGLQEKWHGYSDISANVSRDELVERTREAQS